MEIPTVVEITVINHIAQSSLIHFSTYIIHYPFYWFYTLIPTSTTVNYKISFLTKKVFLRFRKNPLSQTVRLSNMKKFKTCRN